MVSTSVLAALITFLGTLFLGQLYVTLWTWRHAASLGGTDEERVVELESYQRTALDEEITTLFTQIDEKVDDGGDLPPDVTKRDHVAEVINRAIGEDDIEPVVDELDSVDKPANLYDKHKSAYESATEKFLYGSVLTLTLGAAIALATIYGQSPFSGIYPAGYLVLSIFIVQNGYNGIQKFLTAQSIKDEFESMWREYKRVD